MSALSDHEINVDALSDLDLGFDPTQPDPEPENEQETTAELNAEADALETDSDPSVAGETALPENEPDPETGKLFEVPRTFVAVDSTDPSILKLSFSGAIVLDRSIPADVNFYNKLTAGRTVSLELEAHVAGAKTTHRRDKEGDVDAVVQVKSLIVHSIDSA